MLYNVNYVVFDCETGGLDYKKHPMVELALYILNSDLQPIKEYETLIKPYGNLILTPGAMEVHKIPLEDIQKGKDVKVVVGELIDILKPLKVGKFGKPIMVGHNFEKFDGPYLQSIFEFCGKNMYDVVDTHFEDTMWIARKKWGNKDQIANFQLTTCCNKAGIDLIQGHRAMNDTKVTAKLFEYFMNCLISEGQIEGKKEEKVREKFRF